MKTLCQNWIILFLQVLQVINKNLTNAVFCHEDDAWSQVDETLKVIKWILRGLWMGEPNSIATHLTVVEKFHSKRNLLTSWWLERKCQVVTKIIRIHHVGTMNIYIKCHGNPSTSYNHSVWSEVLDGRSDQLRMA